MCGMPRARSSPTSTRIDAQRAQLDASSEHTARMEREAQAEPEADRQAETPYEMDKELLAAELAASAFDPFPAVRVQRG